MQMYKKNAERTTPRRRTAKIAAARPERPAWREKRAVRMSDGRFAAVYEYQETLGLYRPSKMFLED